MAWSDPPTRKQLVALSRIASRSGRTYVIPETREEAAKQLQRIRFPRRRRRRRMPN